MSLLTIIGLLIYIAIGCVVGQAVVCLNSDIDGYWPDRAVKKICLFLYGFVLWPLLIVFAIVFLYCALANRPGA